MSRTKRLKRKQPYSRRICNFCRKIDLYGRNVSLSYEGEDKFKTYIGAATSFVIGTVMFIYFIYLFIILIEKSNSSVSKTSLRKELSQNVEIEYIGVNNFLFGFSVDMDGYNVLQDPSYLTFTLNEVRQLYVNNSGSNALYKRELTSISVK